MLNKGPAMVLLCWIQLFRRAGSQCFVALGGRAEGKDNFNLSSSIVTRFKRDPVFLSKPAKSSRFFFFQELRSHDPGM